MERISGEVIVGNGTEVGGKNIPASRFFVKPGRARPEPDFPSTRSPPAGVGEEVRPFARSGSKREEDTRSNVALSHEIGLYRDEAASRRRAEEPSRGGEKRGPDAAVHPEADSR